MINHYRVYCDNEVIREMSWHLLTPPENFLHELDVICADYPLATICHYEDTEHTPVSTFLISWSMKLSAMGKLTEKELVKYIKSVLSCYPTL